jgi:hypothetical protein
MLGGRYDLLFLRKENPISPNPQPELQRPFIAKFLVPGIEVTAGPAFRQPLYSDALFHALPQSTILSSSLHESQIMTQ